MTVERLRIREMYFPWTNKVKYLGIIMIVSSSMNPHPSSSQTTVYSILVSLTMTLKLDKMFANPYELWKIIYAASIRGYFVITYKRKLQSALDRRAGASH